MRKHIVISLVVLLLPLGALAQSVSLIESTENTTTMQFRMGADFTKKFAHDIDLSFSEEIRLQMYPMSAYTLLSRSFTTVDLSYKPIQYLKLDVGYMLKVVGNSKDKKSKFEKHWSDPNECIRHRIFGSLTGIFKRDNFRLTLRERFLCDMRTDEIDPREKNKYDCLLRSKLGADYSIKQVHLRPYAWVEVENTLNAPALQQKNGHQFISQVRTCLGVKYKLNKHNDLNFFYRLDYGNGRDVDIDDLTLTIRHAYTNAIGVTYCFDW